MAINYSIDPCLNIDQNYKDNALFKRAVLTTICKMVPDAAKILGKVSLIDSLGSDITLANPLPVAATVNIPGGLATEATLSALNAKVTICNTNSVAISSAPTLTVNLPLGAATEATLAALNAKVTACDTGNVTVSTLPAITGIVSVNNAGGVAAVNIQDGGNSITVDGSVSVSSIPAISGSVTVSNAAGGSAVNIQDGGNSITVDGSVSVSSIPAISGSVTVSNAAGGSAVNIQDGGNSITVDGTVAVSSMPGITQTASVSAANSSTSNLNVGNAYTFTGTLASTLGVAAIQVSLFADQNCTVSVQQSQDNVPHWDITDNYNYYANQNFGITVQAVSSYFRVVVTTASLTTTVFRLQSILCPVVEAVPRTLDADQHLQVAIKSSQDEYAFTAEYTPMGEQRFVEPYRLVGAIFDGATLDTNFWVATVDVTGTPGSVVQANAQVTLNSGTNAASFSKLHSFRRGRYVSAAANRWRGVIQLGDAGTANNTRRWGIAWGSSMPTLSDGAWFQLSGTTFSIVTMKTGSTVGRVVNSGSFNGTLGATFAPGTSALTYEIYWTNSKVYFVVSGQILHTVSAAAATWADTMQHHSYIDNINSGNTSNVVIQARVASIYRLGAPETSPIWRNINTALVTLAVLKRGPGRLHKVVYNTIPNTSIVSIYDSIGAATNPIGVMNPPNGATPFSTLYDLDFYNGLTVSTTPNALDITFVYE